MQFLKTLFWIVLAVLVALFSYHNWSVVTISLWSGLRLDTKLPVLVIGAFLLGLIPALIIHHANRWQMRRRLEAAERSLADLRGPVDTAAPASPLPQSRSVPPASVPIAVPPAV